MPIAAIGIGLGTALAGGAAAGATIYGAKKQSSAIKDAAKAEQSYQDKALAAAEEQKVYEREQERLRLEREAEQRAYDRTLESDRIARDERRYQEEYGTGGRYADERDYKRGQRSAYLSRLEPYRQPSTGALSRIESMLGGGGGRVAPMGGGMVQMRAPNGEIASIPEAQAAHFEARGAVRA